MSRVFVDVGVSLDGFVAGANRGPGNPLGDGGLAVHAWMFATAAFRERHPGVAGDDVWPTGVALEPCGASASPRVHHLDFRVRDLRGR